MMDIFDPEIKQLARDKGFDNIKVKDITCTTPSKPLFEKIFGLTEEGKAMGYSTCKKTIFAAAKRQMKSAPLPDPIVIKEFVQFGKRVIDKELGYHLRNFGYSYNMWYNHLTKKKQEDMDKVEQWINNEYSELNGRIDYKMLCYEGICKVEIQDEDGKPRMVCSIPPLIKYVMGPVCWHLEDLFARKLKGYCGGKNLTEIQNEINKHIANGFSKIVEGDGSGFDNSQDVTCKELDRYIYRLIEDKVYHVPKPLFRMISQAIYKTMNIVTMDHNTKKKQTLMRYTVLGTVFSGDCDTTLMNTMRMAMYNRFVQYKMGWIYDQDYILFSKGDDYSVMYRTNIVDEQIRLAYEKYFLSKFKPKPGEPEYDNRTYGIGQINKFLEIGDPTTFKFCSLRSWYYDTDKIMLTRNPAKLYNLSLYARKTKMYNLPTLAVYAQQQAQSLNASYKGIDVFDVAAWHWNKLYEVLREKYPVQVARLEKQQMMLDNIRKTLELENEGMRIMYEIKPRSNGVKLKENKTYWESMKEYYTVQTQVFNEEELRKINAQINSEFDPHELDLLMGQNRFYNATKEKH
jgi:hypothetical protein